MSFPSSGSSDMGANLVPGGVELRVWAPRARRVEALVGGHVERATRGGPANQAMANAQGSGQALDLTRQDDGTWRLLLAGGGPGLRYRYRVDGQGAYPDPYSRFQPEGVHGPSEVVDPNSYVWHDMDWMGARPDKLVIYECHVGTFTPEGTFDSLIDRLPYLAELGVTALELMPLAQCPGGRNWGYDGVDLFAPSHSYGGPRAARRLVDAAHAAGLGVIIDVVYNHFGPEGNYLRQFSSDYFTNRHHTPWGDAVNYDGDNSRWVRKLAIDNACFWLREFHADGLRLDATFAIQDSSPRHLLAELSDTVRQAFPRAVLIAETSENEPRYFRSTAEGGYGFDAIWADDFHHTVRRRVAGDDEGYFVDYQGTTEEVARTIQRGFLYEGHRSAWSSASRGKPARDEAAFHFVYCIQNHDQVGNRAFGDRLNHDIGLDLYRAVSALLLLLPYTPMLFMGQEMATSSPFQYFTDHGADLGKLVTKGRREEFKSYSAFADPAVAQTIPDPQAEKTFLGSKLEWREMETAPGSQVLALYRECLRLRRQDPVLSTVERSGLMSRAVSSDLLGVGLAAPAGRRLLLVNFAPEAAAMPTLELQAMGLPGAGWRGLLSTGEARFGGPCGEVNLLTREVTSLPASSAVLLAVD